MDNNQTSVPFIVHESIVSRMERTIKRLWVLCIIMFVSLVITNGLWICYETSFEDVITTTTIDAEQGEGVNIISGGDINYGTTGENN